MGMNETTSIEHQLRYETAKANLYAKTLKTLIATLKRVAYDAENTINDCEKLIDHDWSKLIELGMVSNERRI